MNLCENMNSYSINNIFFLEPIKNTVIEDSNFIRILYSNKLFTLNGLYLYILFHDIYTIVNNNKIKYYIITQKNSEIIKFLNQLENNLLEYANINKKKIMKLEDQLESGLIKVINHNFSNNNNNNNITNKYILKISGIWESASEYGLTYKFIDSIS